MTEGILTVRQATDRIKSLLERQFSYIWVQGEVTNLTRPGSGHLYFSLKDGDALLACVWFRGRQRVQDTVDPLTGEVFEDGPRPGLAYSLRNGQTLACSGQISVYPPRGGYQLLVDLAQDAGEGALYEAFERLKRELRAEGLFESERKRPLPVHPLRVALITSPSGAAVHDFLRLAAGRGTGAEVRVYPAMVQGDEAPEQLVRAVQLAVADTWPDGKKADVVALVRGGGSLQDLRAFNDARLARNLAASPIPVVTGIGHEIDTTIADLVADVRAATPSHVAQVLWPEREWYAQRVDDLEQAMSRAFNRRAARDAERLLALDQGLGWLSPGRAVRRLRERAASLAERLDHAFAVGLGVRRERMRMAADRCRSGGAVMLARPHARLAQLESLLPRRIEPLFAEARHKLQRLMWQLHTAGRDELERASRSREQAEALLARFDPLAPLCRGYALARDAQGRCIRTVRAVQSGDAAEILIIDGTLTARIERVSPRSP
jgi:exodeoxyribonuclease VII large subunit